MAGAHCEGWYIHIYKYICIYIYIIQSLTKPVHFPDSEVIAHSVPMTCCQQNDCVPYSGAGLVPGGAEDNRSYDFIGPMHESSVTGDVRGRPSVSVAYAWHFARLTIAHVIYGARATCWSTNVLNVRCTSTMLVGQHCGGCCLQLACRRTSHPSRAHSVLQPPTEHRR